MSRKENLQIANLSIFPESPMILGDHISLSDVTNFKFIKENFGFVVEKNLEVGDFVNNPFLDEHHTENFFMNEWMIQDKPYMYSGKVGPKSEVTNDDVEDNLSIGPNCSDAQERNIEESKTTEITIEETKEANTSVSELNLSKKLGRKPQFTGLSQRKDVVLKSILRKIRSYFWRKFNEVTKFMALKRKKSKCFFGDCLKSFIISELHLEPTKEMIFKFGSIISSKHMTSLYLQQQNKQHYLNKEMKTVSKDTLQAADNSANSDELEAIKEIHDTFNKFSMSKFRCISKCQHMYQILRCYAKLTETSQVHSDGKMTDMQIGLEMLLKCSNPTAHQL